MIRESSLPACRLQRGFSLVTAVFLIVVLALLGVFIVSIAGLQKGGQQADLLGARAYQAARAGVEWAAFQVLDPNNTKNPLSCTPTVMPSCPPLTHLPLGGSLSSFTVSVTCTASPPTTEGNRDIQIFQITATACNQPSGGAPASCPGAAGGGYVERQITATLSKCKDSTATAPRCSCS